MTRYTGMLAVIIFGILIFIGLTSSAWAKRPSESQIKEHCAQVVNYLGIGLLRTKAAGDSSLDKMLALADEVFKDYPSYFIDAVKSYTRSVWNQQNEEYHTEKLWSACIRYNQENLPREFW